MKGKKLFRDFQFSKVPMKKDDGMVEKCHMTWFTDNPRYIVGDVTVEWWIDGMISFSGGIVSDEWCDKGIGSEIMSFLINEIGVNTVAVEFEDAKSICFYRDFGFVPTETNEGILKLERKVYE